MTYYGLDKIPQDKGEAWLKTIVNAQYKLSSLKTEYYILSDIFSFIGARIDWDGKLGTTEAVEDE